MEKIAFIVDRLNMPPFNKGFNTMTEFDSKSSLELLDICCEIIATINPDQEAILKETTEFKVHTIISFLVLMKFNIPDDQMDDFRGLLMNGDKEILQTIMHWCLQRFENLQKRAYLAKYLVPVDIPMEFMNDDLIIELSQHLKDLQAEFKEIHKLADKLQVNGNSPADLKAQITQLELERTQLQNKIQKMKKEAQSDEAYFQQMLKVQGHFVVGVFH
jgi:intraflagellar transport protein 81